MNYRTAAVCLALTATLCSAQEQGEPLERAQSLPAQSAPTDDPVLLPPVPDSIVLPEAIEVVPADPIGLPLPGQGQPIEVVTADPTESAQAGPTEVTDLDIDPALAEALEAVPLTLAGRDSRDGATQSQLLLSNGEKPGQLRIQRNVTLSDGSVAVQTGVGKVRGDRVRVKLDTTDAGLTNLMAGEPLEPVDLNLRLNRRTNVVTAEGLCKTHEFTAQGTATNELAPLLDANQGRTRTFLGKLKLRFKALAAKVKKLFYGMRAKVSAWRAKRAAKRSGKATEAAARHRENAQRFALKAQGPQALVPAEPVTIKRPVIGKGQALPPAEPIIQAPAEVPAHASQQALPQVDAPLVQGGVEPIQARPRPAKKRNFFSRMWRRVFKKSDR